MLGKRILGGECTLHTEEVDSFLFVIFGLFNRAYVFFSITFGLFNLYLIFVETHHVGVRDEARV